MSRNIDSLPRWVQTIINTLRSERDSARAQVAYLLGEERSRVLLDSNWNSKDQRYLKNTDSVRFLVSDDPKECDWIEVRLTPELGFLEVMASGPLVVAPCVTNRINLSLRD